MGHSISCMFPTDLDGRSLSSTERSAHLEVVIDLARLGDRVEGHVGASTIGTLHLDVDVAQVVD